jgi:hypothetical protein
MEQRKLNKTLLTLFSAAALLSSCNVPEKSSETSSIKESESSAHESNSVTPSSSSLAPSSDSLSSEDASSQSEIESSGPASSESQSEASISSSSGESEDDNPKHRFKATPTSSYLLKDGRTSYKVIMPSQSDEMATYAKSELSSLFKEATGIELSFISGDNLAFSESDTYISLGQNAYWESAGLSKQTSFDVYGRDGARILTKGKSIFIFGQSNYATLYGVYDFLKLSLNFESYYNDCYTLDKNVTDLLLCDYDVVDIPDLAYRHKRGLLFPTASQNQMFTYRMRVTDDTVSLILPIYEGDTSGSKANINHNSFYYFPTSVYQESHPNFYSTRGDQLCFTAHGDKEELTEMINIAAKKIEDTLTWHPYAQYPNYTTVFLGMNDVADLCSCDACEAMKKDHYNSPTASVIIFLKQVGKIVNEWMEQPENAAYKRDLSYSFFAYQSALTPPFKENDDGTFSYSEDIIPDEGVKLRPYVAFSNFDYGHSFYSTENAEMRQVLRAWGNFYPGSWAWSYGGFFNDYLTFFDLYSFYSDYHEYLAQYGYSFSFEQVKNDQRGADPGFGGLANYILCKKSWNASLDINELIDDFIDNMYLEAAGTIKEMFVKLRLWFARITEKFGLGRGGNGLSDISSNSKYWGYGFVEELFSLCDKAYSEIEIYKKDETKYKRLKNYIDIEWIIPAKVAIGCYEDKFKADEFTELKTKFKNICLDLGIKDIKEFVSISSYLESLGV